MLFKCLLGNDNQKVLILILLLYPGKKADLYDRTNPDWAPSLHLGPLTGAEAAAPVHYSAKKRYERVKGRKAFKIQRF